MAYSAVVAPVSAPQNSSVVSWSATGAIGSAGGASVSGADDVVLMLSSLAADPFALCERIFSLRGRTWACPEERTDLWKPFGRPQAMDVRVVMPSTAVGVEVAIQELLAQSSRRMAMITSSWRRPLKNTASRRRPSSTNPAFAYEAMPRVLNAQVCSSMRLSPNC